VREENRMPQPSAAAERSDLARIEPAFRTEIHSDRITAEAGQITDFAR
jgi:hypothetical protein